MSSDSSPRSYTNLTMSPLRANVIGSLFAVPLFLLPCGLYAFIWDVSNVSAPPGSMLILLFAFIAAVVAHELLHGMGFLLGGASREEVDFGIHWHVLSPYAHCRTPLRTGAYRLALVLPAIVLGLLPATLGLLFGGAWIVFFGAVMLAVAGGDAVVLWILRRVPQRAWVQDHPTEIGCLVLNDGSAETAPERVATGPTTEQEVPSLSEEDTR